MRRSLVFVLGLVGAFAIGAVPAQAQSAHWDPPNQDVVAESTDSILEYGDGSVECDISEAQANTNDDGSGGNTPNGLLNGLTFGTPPGFNDCQVNPLGSVENITTDGFPWALNAVQATGGGSGDGDAEVVIPNDPNAGAWVDIDLGIFGSCSLHVEGDDQTSPVAAEWDATTQTLSVGNAINDPDNVQVTRVGSSLCGPASDTGTFSGNYVRVDQGPDVTIQPWP